MNEAEWLACEHPDRLLDRLRGTRRDRKLHMLSVAACRRVRPLLTPRHQRMLEVAERYADGLVGDTEYRARWREADAESRLAAQPSPTLLSYAVETALRSIPPAFPSIASALSNAARAAGLAARERVSESVSELVAEVEHESELRAQSALLRDIFGNPFRPVAFADSWRSETVVALASAIYAERAFDRLPILADALEEAGCDHPDVLVHCRGPGPHVRGCWVVDLVLGKG